MSGLDRLNCLADFFYSLGSCMIGHAVDDLAVFVAFLEFFFLLEKYVVS